MTWEEFTARVRTFQRGFMGAPKEVRPGRGVFHENPTSCICDNPDAKTTIVSVQKSPGKVSSPVKTDVGLVSDDANMADDLEWSDPEDDEDIKNQQGNTVYNETSLEVEDYGLLSEEPELDDLLSD